MFCFLNYVPSSFPSPLAGEGQGEGALVRYSPSPHSSPVKDEEANRFTPGQSQWRVLSPDPLELQDQVQNQP
jgi:hypothetical protein